MCANDQHTVDASQGVQQTFVTLGIRHETFEEVVGVARYAPAAGDVSALIDRSFELREPWPRSHPAQAQFDERADRAVQERGIDHRQVSANDVGVFEGSNTPQALRFGEPDPRAELRVHDSDVGRQLLHDQPIHVVKAPHVPCSSRAISAASRAR